MAIHVECPECGDIIEIGVTITTADPVNGNLRIEAEPDMADVWAHSWTHLVES